MQKMAIQTKANITEDQNEQSQVATATMRLAGSSPTPLCDIYILLN